MIQIENLINQKIISSETDILGLFKTLKKEKRYIEGLKYIEENKMSIPIYNIKMIISVNDNLEELIDEFIVKNPKSIYTPFILYKLIVNHKYYDDVNIYINIFTEYKELYKENHIKLILIDQISYEFLANRCKYESIMTSQLLLLILLDKFKGYVKIEFINILINNLKSKKSLSLDEFSSLFEVLIYFYNSNNEVKDTIYKILQYISLPGNKRTYNILFLDKIISKMSNKVYNKLLNIVEDCVELGILNNSDLQRYTKVIFTINEK